MTPSDAETSSSDFLLADSHSRSVWIEDRLAEITEARRLGLADPVEAMIAEHPEWDAERTIRLIYEDHCERRERGEATGSREIAERYPQYRDELSVLFHFDRMVRSHRRTGDFPEVGARLGPFRIVDELGRGASGRVYLAAETDLSDRLVVLKVQPLDQDEHLRLAQLQNTHIIPLFSEQTFGDRGLRALCMPYLGGACLDRLLDGLATRSPETRRGSDLVAALDRLQPRAIENHDLQSPYRLHLQGETWVRSICLIAACLADALHAAHSRGLIHMDLKPSNVLIAGDGLPLLLDFHLARRPLEPDERVSGRLGGTPGWMAPEQAEAFEAAKLGRAIPTRVDHRCDLHALGLLLAVALDGHTEPGACRFPSGRWTARHPEVSPGLTDIVRRCLARDPAARYESAKALADDLRRHLDDLPLRGVRNRSLAERWRKCRRRSPKILLRLFLGSVGIGSLLAAGVIGGSDRFLRLRDADHALASARFSLSRGHYREAEAALSHGLERIDARWDASRFRDLRASLALARTGQLADELHLLAEDVRFRLGPETSDTSGTRNLERLFPRFWDRRAELLAWGRNSPDPRVFERVRTDLLELATLLADRGGQTAFGPDLHDVDEEASALRVELGESNAPDRNELGRRHLRAGRFAEAGEQLEALARDRPQDFWSHFYRGVCAYHLGRWGDAAEAFRVCEALSPARAECAYNRARALEAQGRLDLAASSYSRAIALDPRIARAWLNRGLLRSRNGEEAAALPDLDRAIALSDTPDLLATAQEARKITLDRLRRRGESPSDRRAR